MRQKAPASEKAAATKALLRGGDAEALHFAVEVAALQAQRSGRLRHVPAVLLQFSQDKFAFVGAAGFVQRVVGLLRAFGGAAEKFWRQVVGLDFCLWADDDQALDEVAKFADVAGPGIAEENVHGGIAQFADFFAVGDAEFVQEMVG